MHGSPLPQPSRTNHHLAFVACDHLGRRSGERGQAKRQYLVGNRSLDIISLLKVSIRISSVYQVPGTRYQVHFCYYACLQLYNVHRWLQRRSLIHIPRSMFLLLCWPSDNVQHMLQRRPPWRAVWGLRE